MYADIAFYVLNLDKSQCNYFLNNLKCKLLFLCGNYFLNEAVTLLELHYLSRYLLVDISLLY